MLDNLELLLMNKTCMDMQLLLVLAMTADLENLLPRQEPPVEFITLTDGTVTKKPSVCAKTKKKIKLKKKLIKTASGYGSGIAFLIGFFLCLIFSSILFTVRTHSDCSRNATDENNSKCKKRFVGYYSGHRKITEEQIEKLTHIIFNGIQMQEDGKIVFGSYKKRQMFIDMKNKARKKESDVKLMFATDAHRLNHKLIAPVMTESKLRKIWISSVSSFLLEQQLDGVEISYRWPITSEDKENFAFFVRELRYELEKVDKLAKRKDPFIISIHSHPSYWTPEDVPLLDDILNYVDFFNVETDNFYVPVCTKNNMTGPQSPLYSLGNDNQSIDDTMKAYTCRTMKPSQLNVILPFRVTYWKIVSKNVTQADDLHIDVGGTHISGYHFAWRDLSPLGWNSTQASWHNVAKTPYIWHSNQRSFVTFENQRSLKIKMEYILSKNLGGVTVDTIDEDDDSNTLLNALTSMDACSGPKFQKEEIMYNCNKLA
ncbi:unnamed protein product [Caenorhabditis brenneri]